MFQWRQHLNFRALCVTTALWVLLLFYDFTCSTYIRGEHHSYQAHVSWKLNICSILPAGCRLLLLRQYNTVIASHVWKQDPWQACIQEATSITCCRVDSCIQLVCQMAPFYDHCMIELAYTNVCRCAAISSQRIKICVHNDTEVWICDCQTSKTKRKLTTWRHTNRSNCW